MYCFDNITHVFNTSSTVFSQNDLNEQFIAAKWHVLWDNASSVKTTDKRNVRNVRIVRITLCWLSPIVLCVAIVPLLNLNLLVFSSSYLGLDFTKWVIVCIGRNALNLWFCNPNALKWPVDMHRFNPQWLVCFLLSKFW